MIRKGILKLAVGVIFMLSVAGCGNEGNSNTNGTITLTADAPVTGAGTAVLNAAATVTPAPLTGGVPPGLAGAEVIFTATQYGLDSGSGLFVTVETYTNKAFTNSVGVATMLAHAFQQQTFATTIQVTASSNALTSQTINIAVPLFVPL